MSRTFLFLQGPCSAFFKRLGNALAERNHKVIKVNFNGGDVLCWLGKNAIWFHRTRKRWMSRLSRIIHDHKVTDIFVMGDWRPLHIEAADLAKVFQLNFYAFDEGYLRPGYITMEKGGVNGRSSLPSSPYDIRREARDLAEPPEPAILASHSRALYQRHIFYYTGYFCLSFLFPFYRTHRPQSAIREMLLGWLPHKCKSRTLERRTADALQKLEDSKQPFFLFPLQLDSDAQVRRYSPFSGMLEGISHVLTSFAKHAPPNTAILVKNHPLDYGLIDYRTYIRHYAKALNIYDRIFFIDHGNGPALIKKSLGLVLLNSTIGLQAIGMGKPVYCLGKAVYAMPGLAVSPAEQKLNDFWQDPGRPDLDLYADFVKVLRYKALINGNFYTDEGISLAVEGILERLELE